MAAYFGLRMIMIMMMMKGRMSRKWLLIFLLLKPPIHQLTRIPKPWVTQHRLQIQPLMFLGSRFWKYPCRGRWCHLQSLFLVPGKYPLSTHIYLCSPLFEQIFRTSFFCVTPEHLEMHPMHQQNKLPMGFTSRDSFDQWNPRNDILVQVLVFTCVVCWQTLLHALSLYLQTDKELKDRRNDYFNGSPYKSSLWCRPSPNSTKSRHKNEWNICMKPVLWIPRVPLSPYIPGLGCPKSLI